MSAGKLPLPPGPKGTFLMGNLKDFVTKRLDFLTETAREFGDISRFRFGPRRIYLINHPDLIEQVLVTDSKHYIKHFGARIYKPILGNGLVTSEGDFWLRQRRLSQPAFLKHRIASYATAMTDFTETMLDTWQPGSYTDIHSQMSGVTSAIALKTLFDLVNDTDRSTFTTSLREVFDLLSLRFRRPIPIPDWIPTPNNRRLKRRLAELAAVVDGFIQVGKARKEPGNDLLSMLLAAKDEDGTRMSDAQLHDEIMTLYLAGHETTALTLSWTWYLLAQNPQVEDLLATEWKVVLHGRTPTADDIPKLPYTEAVITEAMRMLPPVYLIGREATKNLELGGYRVPKGTTVFMSQWVTHRDPRWFEKPDEFKPERWTGGLMKRLPKYAYYPFGGGPRVCIGNYFALMEAALILATVGQRWKFTIDHERIVDYWPSITLLPRDGIWATLQPRGSAFSSRLEPDFAASRNGD